MRQVMSSGFVALASTWMLAYAQPEVADFIVENVFSWLLEYRMDGFRFDSLQRVLYVESHHTAGNAGKRLPVSIAPNDPTGRAARKRAILAATGPKQRGTRTCGASIAT